MLHIGSGVGNKTGSASGIVVMANSLDEPYVIALDHVVPAHVVLIKDAAGLLTAGGPLSHGVIVCRAWGIPCIGSFDLGILTEGDYVTLDTDTGWVYKE